MSLTNKKYKMSKFVGLSIISSIWIFLIFIIFLLLFEYLGFANLIKNKLSENNKSIDIEKSLRDNLYYGNKWDKDYDPYEYFKNQYLHPYYLFGLPWKKTDQLKLNNKVVKLNKDGFRISGINEENIDALLLGGSTAFGHYSTSNENTIASILSSKTKYSFANLNAPSWNSHQELIALLKYKKDTKLSISFSLANDISHYCRIYDRQFVDQQENFPNLYKVFNNYNLSIRSLIFSKIKNIFKSVFPETFSTLKKIKRNNPVFIEEPNYCNESDVEIVSNSFIFNQKNMHSIMFSKGGKHITILQPHIDLLKEENNFRKKVYKKVMNSKYCQANCYQFSTFSNNNIKEILFNGKNLNTAFFADKVHLTDRGVRLISQKIIKIIE